jgi:putative transcriptional regulator
MMRTFALAAFFALLAATEAASGQPLPPPNGLLLVAKPGLLDPNFRRTVVLVTQTEDASTVGVILNRPLREPLARFLPDEPGAANYRDRVFEGGPVLRRAVIALFQSETPPSAPAFHVLRGVWLTMHPQNIRELLADSSRRYRLYAGFSGWAPRQLESEFARDGWYVLRADVETLFRRNTDGMWEELVRKAATPAPTTGVDAHTVAESVAENAIRRRASAPRTESPALGGALRPGIPGRRRKSGARFDAAERRARRPLHTPSCRRRRSLRRSIRTGRPESRNRDLRD